MLTLHDWQEQDVAEWVDASVTGRSKSVFVAWEQSLGKTVAATEYAKRIHAEVIIVVGPLNTKRSWRNTVKDQYPGMPFVSITNTKKEIVNLNRLTDRVRGVYFIGWELMRTGMLEGINADLIIADETHRQQNRGSVNHNTLIGINGTNKMALSGTPAGNQPDGIFATLKWLWPLRYKSHQKWVDTFWRVRRNGAIIDFVREITPGGVLADIPLFSRRLRADHRADLPKALPEKVIEVDLTPGQWKLYNQIKLSSAAWFGDDFVPTSIPLVEDLRLTQITLGVPHVDEDGEVSFPLDTKSSKIAALLEVLAGEPDDATMLVFVPSARIIPAIVHQLNKKGITATGFSGTLTPSNSKERDEAIENFGVTHRVLVASIAAIAEGTDGLQYKCSRQFWMAKHPNWMLNGQAKWRLDRPGQTEPVQSWFTAAMGTVDEARIDRLEEVGAVLDEFIDGK